MSWFSDKLQDFSKQGGVGGKHAKWERCKSFQSLWKNKNFDQKVWWSDKRHTQEENIWSKVTILIHDEQTEKKKKCLTERKRTNKKVFIWPQGSKTPCLKDRERNFWAHFQVNSETSAKKRRSSTFFCSEAQRKWLRLVFEAVLAEKTRFAFEIYFEKVFTRQRKINPQMKIWHLQWATFSLAQVLVENEAPFSQGFYPSSANIFLVCFSCGDWLFCTFWDLWKPTSLGLWRTFSHLSHRLRSGSQWLYIITIRFTK